MRSSICCRHAAELHGNSVIFSSACQQAVMLVLDAGPFPDLRMISIRFRARQCMAHTHLLSIHCILAYSTWR